MKVFIKTLMTMLLLIVCFTSCSSQISWNGNYILNKDGYVKVELKELEEGFEIYMVGLRDYESICNRFIGKIVDQRGIIETNDGNIEIYFTNSNLVISSDNEKYNSIIGEYVVDDNTISEIVSTKELDIDGVFTNGQLFGGLQIDIAKNMDNEYTISINGRKDGKMFMDIVKGESIDDKTIYVSDLSSDNNSKVEAEIKLLSDSINLEIKNNDGAENYNVLNGLYKCMMLDFDLCKKYNYSQLSEGVYGEMTTNIRSKYTNVENVGMGTIHF